MPRPLTADQLATRVARRRATWRGRPRGSTVPLMQCPHRFETAAWAAATLGLRVGPHVAASAIAAVFSPRPIRAEAVGEVLIRLGRGVDHATLKRQGDRIRRRAAAALEQRDDAEETWLVASAGALLQLIQGSGHAAGTAYALDQLHELGWGPTLTRIARRLNEAFQSNLPPIEGPISRRARQLAEALSLKMERPQ